jgi:hypothetical protein
VIDVLLEEAGRLFRLSGNVASDSKAAHLTQYAKWKKARGGGDPEPVEREEQDGLFLPLGTEQIWAAFSDLHRTRHGGMAGPLPITFPDLNAWMLVTDIHLSPWESAAVLDLDRLWLEIHHEQSEKVKKVPEQSSSPSRPSRARR